MLIVFFTSLKDVTYIRVRVFVSQSLPLIVQKKVVGIKLYYINSSQQAVNNWYYKICSVLFLLITLGISEFV